MTRLPLMLLIAAGLATATAQAQTTQEQTPPSAAPATQEAAKAAESTAPATGKRLSGADCVRETGSRITRRDGESRCTGQPGRAYTKDDIDRTGYTNLGDALRALDPAVR